MQIETHWMNYVAIVTGIIGAITGIAGSIMGYIAYRRSNEIKKSDRRIDLHKLRNDAQIADTELSDILSKALLSRKSTMNGRGLLHSSLVRDYVAEHAKDLKHAKELSGEIPLEDVDYDSLSLKQLEQERVHLDRTKGSIDHLIRKYEDSIQEDTNWILLSGGR